MKPMRIAYLDCFAGISGDMFSGALLDAGLDPRVLHDAVAALGIVATLEIEKVNRSGITATKIHVLEADGHIAEAPREAPPSEPKHKSAHTHPEHQHPSNEPDHQHSHEHQHHPKTQHLHKLALEEETSHEPDHPHSHESDHEHSHEPDHEPDHEHAHEHSHDHSSQHHHVHVHGRSLTAIRELLRASSLAEPVKNFAIHTFEVLGHAEAKIHDVPVDEIHFHEVGAVDAIVDITCAAAGIYALSEAALAETGQPLRWHASPLNVGGGTVLCAHGNFPVPAPATADLLRGMPTYSAHLDKELVTPTGAAILRALAPTFGPQPAMSVHHIGYGAGTRNLAGFPNVLRILVGDTAEVISATTFEPASDAGAAKDPSALPEHHKPTADTVVVLETALDDLSPQILAYVTEQALALGALDVMCTAVTMKKGRLGTLLTLLTDDAHSPALERLLLRETSTLGIRIRTDRRICLAREHRSVETAFGPIRIKLGSFDSEELNAAPEFEDCRAAATTHNVPVKHVLQTAMAAWLATKSA